MWLDEIEENITTKYKSCLEHGEGDLALDIAIDDGEIMARVLRELGKYISTLYKELGAYDPQYHSLSDDAKELLSSRKPKL